MTFSNKLGTSYLEGKNQSILARIEPNFDPYHHFLQRKLNQVRGLAGPEASRPAGSFVHSFSAGSFVL
jgi:hypothetical protein